MTRITACRAVVFRAGSGCGRLVYLLFATAVGLKTVCCWSCLDCDSLSVMLIKHVILQYIHTEIWDHSCFICSRLARQTWQRCALTLPCCIPDRAASDGCTHTHLRVLMNSVGVLSDWRGVLERSPQRPCNWIDGCWWCWWVGVGGSRRVSTHCLNV